MKLRFLWVGKTKQREVRGLIQEYLERVRKFAGVEVSELKDRTDAGSDRVRIIEKESGDILDRISGDPCVVALDERGRQLDSFELAGFIERHRLTGTRQITFVVGGHNGLAEDVRKRADLVLALSRMTLPHELARVVLLEQVYRAYSILHDLPYQK